MSLSYLFENTILWFTNYILQIVLKTNFPSWSVLSWISSLLKMWQKFKAGWKLFEVGVQSWMEIIWSWSLKMDELSWMEIIWSLEFEFEDFNYNFPSWSVLSWSSCQSWMEIIWSWSLKLDELSWVGKERRPVKNVSMFYYDSTNYNMQIVF